MQVKPRAWHVAVRFTVLTLWQRLTDMITVIAYLVTGCTYCHKRSVIGSRIKDWQSKPS